MQLEETERTFDLFWSHHSSRLRHCLALRQFEQDFRELQARLDQHLKTVEDMTEVGETQIRVDQLLRDTSSFQRICRVRDSCYFSLSFFLLRLHFDTRVYDTFLNVIMNHLHMKKMVPGKIS